MNLIYPPLNKIIGYKEQPYKNRNNVEHIKVNSKSRRPICVLQQYLNTTIETKSDKQQYDNETALIISKVMCHLYHSITKDTKFVFHNTKQGWNKFGEEAKMSTSKVMEQLYERSAFCPINPSK